MLVESDDRELMVRVLELQYDYYDAYGLPRARDVGRAVFQAVMHAIEEASLAGDDGSDGSTA